MLLSDWRQFVEADSTIARPPAAARPLLALFSGVSAFVHGLAFATALGYGLYHLLLQSQLIALLSFVSCFGIAMSHWRSAHDRDATSYRYLVIGAMTLELVITSYMLGYRGLILVFPLTASFLFLLPFKQAVWLGVLAVLACLLASSNVLELEVVVRHGIALLLSLGFSAAFAYSLHQQKDALDADVNQDYLTGIASRRGFTRWLDSLPSRTDMQAKPMALFYVDIDDFKRINDTY
ncbi:MAG: diguanylate cyclase, partial [Gammaproteobacteria bacterium]|nr:diguanylate cyclase [Gammaproteobacteria bacterium]